MAKSKKANPKKQKNKQHNQIVRREEAYQGPIPPPVILAQYDQIQSGLADRIMKMAESETAHRQSIENRAIDADIVFKGKEYTERRIGQFLGFCIGTAAIFCGSYTAIHGQPLVGGLFGTGGVLGLVTAFIYGRSKLDIKKDVNSNTSTQDTTN